MPESSPYVNSSQDYYGGPGTGGTVMPLPIRRNVPPVQFRNVDVGMFSGPRPSYQRYSASPAASGVITKTGA